MSTIKARGFGGWVKEATSFLRARRGWGFINWGTQLLPTQVNSFIPSIEVTCFKEIPVVGLSVTSNITYNIIIQSEIWSENE